MCTKIPSNFKLLYIWWGGGSSCRVRDFFLIYAFLQVFTCSCINISWLNTGFAHTTALPQRHLLPAAKEGEGGSVQCSTIYPFQTRFDLEKNQPQLAGYQKPNKLFYLLIIIHILGK